MRRNLEHDYRVYTASTVSQAIELLDSRHIDLVITDMKLPEHSGFDLIRHIRENLKETEVIMVTGYASIEGAVKAVKAGAVEYLAKPFTAEELYGAVVRSIEKLKTRKARNMPADLSQTSFGGLIGESGVMLSVFETIRKAAATPATVLITGESGTGKELIARAVHYNSARSKAPFVPVNCSAIPEQLIERELFGYVKGSFTGAQETRAGFFQVADGGSIFLDDIAEMPLQMQVKLLRILQEREIVLVGARRSISVDIRVIAATNKNLPDLIRQKLFREDLYYRLNVITIDIPPLRERGEDIFLLTNYFFAKYAKTTGRAVPTITDEAFQILKSYNWPGNVRELENLIQRFVLLSEGGVIDIPDLPTLMRFSAVSGRSGYNRTLAEVETEYIQHVLESVQGNKTQAAKILGIDRKTLRQKLPEE
ncbi:MAG: sigma-54-dependent Fis family transcriptional regulator [Spirochaetales bacterium]|nr:MAG: sigma-54-dependent Fis family transcriptional regulator [Spirochaetales bacterium]